MKGNLCGLAAGEREEEKTKSSDSQEEGGRSEPCALGESFLEEFPKFWDEVAGER